MATKQRQSAHRKNSSDSKPWNDDEVLREVYANREAYAAECGYSLDRMFEDLMMKEAASRLPRAKIAPATPKRQRKS